MVNIDFTNGDYDQDHTDSNGFWLNIDSFNFTQNKANNTTTLNFTSMDLRAVDKSTDTSWWKSMREPGSWWIYAYLSVTYKLEHEPTARTVYAYGYSAGKLAASWTPSLNDSTTDPPPTPIVPTTKMNPLVIEHNKDGSAPAISIKGRIRVEKLGMYIGALYVGAPSPSPVVTVDAVAGGVLPAFSNFNQGPKVKVDGNWEETIVYVKDNGIWKFAVPYVKENGIWRFGGG